MSDFEINAINKPNRHSQYEHITHIGNNNYSNPWRITRESAINQIEAVSNPNRFYVVDPYTRNKVFIKVVREYGKVPYLKTEADGRLTDNLLSLPECTGRLLS